MEKLGFRPDEAAELLGIRRDLLFKLLREGELRSAKVGRARVIPRVELEAFLQRKMEEGHQ